MLLWLGGCRLAARIPPLAGPVSIRYASPSCPGTCSGDIVHRNPCHSVDTALPPLRFDLHAAPRDAADIVPLLAPRDFSNEGVEQHVLRSEAPATAVAVLKAVGVTL
jgi:hypothetical protein